MSVQRLSLYRGINLRPGDLGVIIEVTDETPREFHLRSTASDEFYDGQAMVLYEALRSALPVGTLHRLGELITKPRDLLAELLEEAGS